MANLGVISLNAGKMTPLVDVRSDIEKYSGGCRILDNMIPLIYGPVTRRPGTKYIAGCEDNAVVSRMVPFVYSSTIAYELEFSALILNVYYNGSAVDEDIVTPYLEADLPHLQFKQVADVLWIVHPSYAPRKLSRTSATEFSLDKISFENGPFIERNDIAEDDDVTIAVTGYSIANATLGVAGAGTFTISGEGDLSSLFATNGRFYVTTSAANANDGAYTVASVAYAAPVLTITANEAVAATNAIGQIMVDGGTVTLTASAATFTTGTSGHTDALFKLTHKREKTVTKGSGTAVGIVGEPIDVKGAWSFNTTGHWDATVEIQRMEDGTNWETFRTYVSTMTDGVGSRNVQKSDIEEADGVQYRIYISAYTDGACAADFTVDESTQDSIFKITATASTISATATAIVAAPEHVATKRWAEGAWSHVRGWPSSITFIEERAVYGFTNSDEQTIWLSATGEYEDFESGINDADSFALTVPTSNRGRWLGSLETLAVGTAGDEWRIKAPLDEALTPTNFDIKKQTNFGSANIQAMEVNEAIIFVDYVTRKIREYTFNDPKQKYISLDLTALAEDITSGGITSIAVQKNPDSIIWFTIANSPYLISMTYEREQNEVAFANHPLGEGGIAESICVTPSTSEDVITLSVQRTINGSTVRYIEEMQPRDWGSDDDDAFFVDCGIIDTGGDTTVEVAHLEGETVSVYVDGAVQTSKTVSSGVITIDEAGTKAIVGLPYMYQVSPMRLDINTQNGTTHGTTKKISELTISFYKTGGAQYGDGTDTYDIDWRTTEDYGTPPALFTGDKVVSFDGGFSMDDNIVISGSDPLPCTVRAIIADIEKVGR